MSDSREQKVCTKFCWKLSETISETHVTNSLWRKCYIKTETIDGYEYSKNKLLYKSSTVDARFEVFTVMKIEFVVFWVVPGIALVGYKHFRGPCCLHL
jgi:hypothetical protein